MVERQILTALLLRREISLEQIWQAFLSAEQTRDSSLQMDEFLQLLVDTGTLPPDIVTSLGQNPDQSTLCLLQGCDRAWHRHLPGAGLTLNAGRRGSPDPA
jgi:hypothetical protein